MRIGIIGIDCLHPINKKILSKEYYNKVLLIIQDFIKNYNKKDIVFISNGLPWFSHIVIDMYLKDEYKDIEFYMPTDINKKINRFENTHEGRNLNILHDEFKEKTSINSLDDLSSLIKKKNKINIKRGFKQCNTLVVNNCDYVFVFGIENNNNIWSKIKCDKKYYNILEL